MLLSLVVSVGIWVYIVTVENPERDQTLYNIPVVFTGEDILREDYDLIISESNVASGVTLTFYGKNSELNKLLDDKMELEVEIDVSRLRSATEFSFSYDMSDITLPASVSNQSITLTGKESHQDHRYPGSAGQEDRAGGGHHRCEGDDRVSGRAGHPGYERNCHRRPR